MRHIGNGGGVSVLALKAVGVAICEVVRNPGSELLDRYPVSETGEVTDPCPQLDGFFFFNLRFC